jgi:enamine deaminase RidA (YjgF/YER057c/UK114 family)
VTETRADRVLVSSGSPFENAHGYSRAVVCGEEVHIAGRHDRIRLCENGNAQRRRRADPQHLFDLVAVLKEAGGALADIVRPRTFVIDSAHFDAVRNIQGEVFGEIRPAATILVVPALLRPEMKVEIEADARLVRQGR